MKSLKALVLVGSSLGLLFLSACNSSSQAPNSGSNSPESPAANTSVATSPSGSAMSDEKEHAEMAGKGMVVESGPYHLELLPEKEAEGTHLDLFLQRGDNHEAIPDAKVTAQVQLPDGSQKSLDMKYDTEGKHYTVLVPSAATGEYKVAILSDIKGEKVNGRFSFKQ